MRKELESLETEIREERRLQEAQIKKIWNKPLFQRIESGRALGRLVIRSIDSQKNLIHFIPPKNDFAFFSEYQQVRISQDCPDENYYEALFLGLTEKGLTIQCTACNQLDFRIENGWSLDEDFFDVSHFYLKAIKALGDDAHGRDNVFPILYGAQSNEIDSDIYEETMDDLEDSDISLNESQIDAVAVALASSPFHLIQGPPGTGKTHTLAQLVARLVKEGHRILVTGFTHRSIHNALKKIQAEVGESCPVVKISQPIPGGELPFPVFPTLEKSDLATSDGPYVIGATPFALFTSRLQSTHFDSAVLDETSQLNVPAAIMVMMKSDRWFFFGDHRQLPPVSLVHQNTPSEASVFGRLKKQCSPTTLNTTYRMNQPLTEWPSEQFYHGDLRSAVPDHCLALKSTPLEYPDLLDPAHSMVRLEVLAPDMLARNEEEADIIAQVVLDLLRSGLPPSEIGIITPFRSQAACIRSLLKGDRFSQSHPNLWKEITVDTVDRFQGQEREMILYSFTSSDLKFLKKLGGFLLQQERLNVAVTRARTKVILLHSPELREYAESLENLSENAAVFTSLLRSAKLISQ